MTTTFPLGERRDIDIGAIEKELAALWKQPEGTSDDAPQITRACVMTLIAPVSGWGEVSEVTNLVSQLTDRFPNRAIVVDVADNRISAQHAAPGEDTLDGWVQAHCQMPGGHTQICCEQITIEARGAAIARVPGAVLPLLVPDVPVILWWPHGTPFDSPLFERLGAFANRVIVDSTTFDDPEHQLERLGAPSRPRQVISDLAWGRLTPWRELTAQFFDSHATVGYLNSVNSVTLRYRTRADQTRDRTQPLLFVGWLATKLGWKIDGSIPSTGAATFTMRRADGEAVQIELQAEGTIDERGDQLDAVELKCAAGRFQVQRDEAIHCALATARAGGIAPLRRVVRLEHLSAADLLAAELRLFGRDQSYEDALQVAAALVKR